MKPFPCALLLSAVFFAANCQAAETTATLNLQAEIPAILKWRPRQGDSFLPIKLTFDRNSFANNVTDAYIISNVKNGTIELELASDPILQTGGNSIGDTIPFSVTLGGLQHNAYRSIERGKKTIVSAEFIGMRRDSGKFRSNLLKISVVPDIAAYRRAAAGTYSTTLKIRASHSPTVL